MSTNYTPNYGLSQWEPGDKVIREDFNADNLKIDTALAGKTERSKILLERSGDGNYDLFSIGFYLKDWNQWDRVFILFDMDNTGSIEGDQIVLQSLNLDPVVKFPMEPAFIVLFPFRDENRLIQGVVLGKETVPFTAGIPFKGTTGLRITSQSTSGVKVNMPKVLIYGIR